MLAIGIIVLGLGLLARRDASDPPHLRRPLRRAERNVRTIVERYVPVFYLTHIGATEIDPKHLAFWVFTHSDTERDRLRSTSGLVDELRDAVRRAGYPEAAIPEIGFAFESKETVDRDFGGNAYYAMK
jgi:hypothetical protein